jgi:hypothetical protein
MDQRQMARKGVLKPTWKVGKELNMPCPLGLCEPKGMQWLSKPNLGLLSWGPQYW